jgi:subfamily B ATP-binding cassette protein HlyB/CyaB
VPQETMLFSGTIYDNLQMASPNASFEQIIAACQMAEIHHLIQSLPQGYQTDIVERGAGLSGGQRQLLFITHGLPKGLHVDAIYRLGAQGAQRVALAPAPEPQAAGATRQGGKRANLSPHKEES